MSPRAWRGKDIVLYNGIDLERFRPRPPTGYLHRELGLREDVPLIGTIGQISLRKGHDVQPRPFHRLSGAGASRLARQPETGRG